MDSLHAEVVEADAVPTLVLAHGFTQTGRCWGPFAGALAASRRLVLADLPGHGGSGEVRADLTQAGRLLVETAADDGPVDLLGYSLGARVALHAALERPDRIRRLVLIGGTAGIEDDGRRAERRARDEAMADDLERSGDVEGFLRRWLAAPMFATLPPSATGLAERRRNGAAGLASSLRLAGTGTQAPLWDRLCGLPVPVLAVAGADDPRFVASARRIAAGVPNGVLSVVPGAGHAVHLHRPAATARLVGRWLDAVG